MYRISNSKLFTDIDNKSTNFKMPINLCQIEMSSISGMEPGRHSRSCLRAPSDRFTRARESAERGREPKQPSIVVSVCVRYLRDPRAARRSLPKPYS